MKNILIIVDGNIGKKFLERLKLVKNEQSKYYIVYFDDTILPEEKSSGCIAYKFDPTSYYKISGLLHQIEFYEIFLILTNKQDLLVTYNNIREIDKELKLVILDRWGCKFDDSNITILEANDILTNRLINFLPNIPVFAKEVGLGQGEIMEMQIPATSNYAYKHVGSFAQNRWKVAAIYRNNKLILPKDNMMILPNDIILAVGNPAVLQSVYKSINQQYGHFPKPYGDSIYVFIDMKFHDEEIIKILINDGFILYSKLNSKKLVIRVINPTISKTFDKIKSYQSTNAEVLIDYEDKESKEIIIKDIKAFDIGLFVTDYNFFKEYITFLYDIKRPIFKIARYGFANIKNSIILSSRDILSVERISPMVFDFSYQLNLDITLLEYQEEDEEANKKIAEHFNALSKLFEKRVNILKLQKNPILELKNRNDFVQIIEFSKKLTEISFFEKLFSTNLQEHVLELIDAYQLFLPNQ